MDVETIFIDPDAILGSDGVMMGVSEEYQRYRNADSINFDLEGD